MTGVMQFKRTNPEAEGIPSSAILGFIEALEQHSFPLDAIQGFMLLRHGNVAAEGWWQPYGSESPHFLYSLSKSFTSSAIGIAVNEGLLTVDDPVLQFFPKEAPASPDKNLHAMRIRHLLAMNTGHVDDTTKQVFDGLDKNWARTFLSLPVEHQPGSWFVYNTAATYMLSAIITKLTGQSLLDYLRPRLFDSLGIKNPVWESDPLGISLGGTGLHITTEDIARFGQLYLQKGRWGEQQILSEAWISEVTMAHSDNSNTQTNPDWTVGYGYQFWRSRHNSYRGDGAFGQYCIVMPEQDAVLIMIGGVRDMQLVLDKVWKHLLPSIQPIPLATNQQDHNKLLSKLENLSLPLPVGESTSAQAQQRSGKTYKLESNNLKLNSAALTFAHDQNTLTFHDQHGVQSIPITYGSWTRTTAEFRTYGKEPIAVCGAWTTEDTYEVRICWYESEYCSLFHFHFRDTDLQLDVEPNVTWNPPVTVTTIIGHLAG